MARVIDWTIEYIANCKCGHCGKNETEFLDDACNAHTHGMGNYNHDDFQIVLDLGPKEIARILNTLGVRVQDGEKFKVGDFISGIYEDCPVRIDDAVEDGRKVLRVVIPDRHNVFCDNQACEHPYSMQILPTSGLTKTAGWELRFPT